MSDNSPAGRAVAWWLLLVCALIFAMVVVGGVTRLTHSGLSMVEWKPLLGAIPPLTEEAWEESFRRYQAFPEYRLVNHRMTLEEYKGIYYVEWFHRLLGRLIGAAFLLPFLWFLWRRAIPRRLAPRMAGIFLLGALQGLLGWYMVKSGLVDDPRVSPYRLTAHLTLAVAIYGMILWSALDLLSPERRAPRGFRPAAGVTALIFLMIASGGLVAGNRAGLAYNTFPLMGDHWIPPGLFVLEPWWHNLFENIALVQFDHRLIAWLLLGAIPWVWWRIWRDEGTPVRARITATLLLGWLPIQVGLGIATLLHRVPVPLASAHQAGALLLFTLALATAHALRPVILSPHERRHPTPYRRLRAAR